MEFTNLPKLGQPLEVGIFCGLTTAPDGQHFAVVLLADRPETKLNWKEARAWAETVGGTLPTRVVATMLFANTKLQFKRAWHWTSDEFDDHYAWGQGFNYGFQDYYHKSSEGLARAVRLIPLEQGSKP